ncbi:hypothetical protein QR680_005419 [Steinernema hermaphroditum]|uniref:Nematode cuticle collagen N-terminal domain-containing protein n=1 Tax=Steinernema hermaphroditum TaxID=289476 RepID=A0AA39LVM2_9BILA|nr:hypothetical protein QR680_005419 [Steinernema hermaphroditum]
MEADGRIKAYKFVAYAAVTFSVVAVLSVVVTLPMVYNYVSHVRRQMHHEISFCKGSAKDIYTEVHHMKNMPQGAHNRTARQSGYGAEVPPDLPEPPASLASPENPELLEPPGEKGICPKYCAIDGGVFFEDGTRR